MFLPNAYSLVVLLACFVTAAYFIWSFWRQGVPDIVRLLIFSIFFAPFAVLGARLWNYLNWADLRNIIDQGSGWQRLLNFLGFGESGLSGISFFGGLVAVICYFSIVFTWYAHKYQVSRWLCFDIMFQALLIFQIISRWGNFFNQELLGRIISENYPQEFAWIPDWLATKLHFPNESQLILRHPLFLYESLANLFLLILLIISKRLGLIKFVFTFKRYPAVTKAIALHKTQLPKQTKLFRSWRVWWSKWQTVYRFYQVNVAKPGVNFNQTPPVYLNARIGPYQWNDDSCLYHRQWLHVQQKYGFWSQIRVKFWMFWRSNSAKLTAHFNPYQLLIPKVGLTTSLYLLGYGIIRLVLQTFREGVYLSEPIDTPYYMAGLLIVLGLVGIYWTQFLSPRKWRSPNWLYETWYWKR